MDKFVSIKLQGKFINEQRNVSELHRVAISNLIT